MTLNKKYLVQDMISSSQEIPLAASSLLMSQNQEFLKNHLARVPVTPNQQGTHEKRDEVHSTVGAQDVDTNGCRCLIWTMLNSAGKLISW